MKGAKAAANLYKMLYNIFCMHSMFLFLFLFFGALMKAQREI